MATYRIPFNRPCLVGSEIRYVSDAIAQGHISGDGSYTQRCQVLLQEALGVPRVLLATSCTHALEMAALLLDLKPGDEFIVPSFTFVSTANAFVLRGARPVFADIRQDTLNLDEMMVKDLISEKTRLIVPVHYAGIACEMDAIVQISEHYRLSVVEDNAHGLFARYRGRYLGTFGSFATQSFHETKNFSCGEGGALIINDVRHIERAEIIREKGTDRSKFFRGQVDKYTWVDKGSSYVPSDILAAFLLAQLEHREAIQRRRKDIWEYYLQQLSYWASRHNVALPCPPPYCEHGYHMFYLVLPSLDARQRLVQHLKSRGILAVFHYLPLHLSQMGLSLGGRLGQCPVAERISDRLLRLPFYNDLTVEDQGLVVESIMEFSEF